MFPWAVFVAMAAAPFIVVPFIAGNHCGAQQSHLGDQIWQRVAGGNDQARSFGLRTCADHVKRAVHRSQFFVCPP